MRVGRSDADVGGVGVYEYERGHPACADATSVLKARAVGILEKQVEAFDVINFHGLVWFVVPTLVGFRLT
jgi:hypothetical protein